MPSAAVACWCLARCWAARYLVRTDAERRDRVLVHRPHLGGPIQRQQFAHAADSIPAPMADFAALAGNIRTWGRELGFQQVGVAGVELGADEAHLLDWLAQGQ